MSLTGRPLSPPLALTSSSQIFIASSDILPLAASGPVSAMPKPMVMGSAARAGALASELAAIVARTQMPAQRRRRCNVSAIVSSLGIQARDKRHIFANPGTSREISGATCSVHSRASGNPVARMSESDMRDPDFAHAHPGYELLAPRFLGDERIVQSSPHLKRHRRAHEVALAEL